MPVRAFRWPPTSWGPGAPLLLEEEPPGPLLPGPELILLSWKGVSLSLSTRLWLPQSPLVFCPPHCEAP